MEERKESMEDIVAEKVAKMLEKKSRFHTWVLTIGSLLAILVIFLGAYITVTKEVQANTIEHTEYENRFHKLEKSIDEIQQLKRQTTVLNVNLQKLLEKQGIKFKTEEDIFLDKQLIK